MRFLVLATGSKGNCAYIGTPHAQVLVDCGIPLRDVAAGLRQHGIDPLQLDALFITHTHSDHIRTVPALLRKHPMRVYCPGAHLPELGALVRNHVAGKSGKAEQAVADAEDDLFSTVQDDGGRPAHDFEFIPVQPNIGFHHRDLDVLPVPVSHDCSPTVMYKFHYADHSVGLLTDLGATEPAQTALFADCQALLLESNHCVDMLLRGRYPQHLKRRIRGERGHLSNDEAAQFALGLGALPQHLLLGHLSDDNNTPQAATAAFSRIELGGMIPHTVIPQRTVGPLVELG
jgi:phosphoribosyl 1,2-cyclic phosphodiesterase